VKNQATPYLIFDGNARDALEFYKDVFEGEIYELQTYGEADYPTPPEAEDKLIHGKFKKDNLFLMVSDNFPGQNVTFGNHISLVLEFESEDEITKTYDRLAQKGTIVMELQDTFWGAKYGKIKDQFGFTWDLNYTKS
jgi:PhnB protein